jgi:8-oxo-dGTP pyrophosphatase MutT (NUDIX family)
VAVGNAERVDRIDRTSLTKEARVAHADRKAAVIPYRIHRDRLEVALVTTSRGKGWIVPKGWVDEGERPRDAAIREAEEEAGLRGVVARKPLGRYRHGNRNGACRVDVYLMRVTDVLDHWGEAKFRRRRWMPISDAAACVRDELRQFVHGIEQLVGTHSGARQ